MPSRRTFSCPPSKRNALVLDVRLCVTIAQTAFALPWPTPAAAWTREDIGRVASRAATLLRGSGPFYLKLIGWRDDQGLSFYVSHDTRASYPRGEVRWRGQPSLIPTDTRAATDEPGHGRSGAVWPREWPGHERGHAGPGTSSN
jgi:hypothetical protein